MGPTCVPMDLAKTVDLDAQLGGGRLNLKSDSRAKGSVAPRRHATKRHLLNEKTRFFVSLAASKTDF